MSKNQWSKRIISCLFLFLVSSFSFADDLPYPEIGILSPQEAEQHRQKFLQLFQPGQYQIGKCKMEVLTRTDANSPLVIVESSQNDPFLFWNKGSKILSDSISSDPSKGQMRFAIIQYGKKIDGLYSYEDQYEVNLSDGKIIGLKNDFKYYYSNGSIHGGGRYCE